MILPVQKKRGFTLIEILVVVAIIGIIASVVIMSLAEAKKKSRDTQRESDLAQLQLALRIYFDANGTYLVNGGGWGGGGNGWTSYTNADDSYPKSIVQVLYEGGYLASPDLKDPLDTTYGGYMIFLCDQDARGNYRAYSLSATKENEIPSELDYARTVCNSDTNPPGNTNSIVSTYGKNYAVGNKTY